MYNKDKADKKRMAIEYADTNQVDRSVLLAIGSIHKVNFKTLEKEELNMRTLFEEIKREGELIGEARGQIVGRITEIISSRREFNMEDDAIVLKLQQERLALIWRNPENISNSSIISPLRGLS